MDHAANGIKQFLAPKNTQKTEETSPPQKGLESPSKPSDGGHNCETCGVWVLDSETQGHRDFHVAEQMQRDWRNGEETAPPQEELKIPSEPCGGGHNCETCGVWVLDSEAQGHRDFHVAQQMQRDWRAEGAAARASIPKAKPKLKGSYSKASKRPNQSIMSFLDRNSNPKRKK